MKKPKKETATAVCGCLWLAMWIPIIVFADLRDYDYAPLHGIEYFLYNAVMCGAVPIWLVSMIIIVGLTPNMAGGAKDDIYREIGLCSFSMSLVLLCVAIAIKKMILSTICLNLLFLIPLIFAKMYDGDYKDK